MGLLECFENTGFLTVRRVSSRFPQYLKISLACFQILLCGVGEFYVVNIVDELCLHVFWQKGKRFGEW
jgi:hypothetical protein